MPGPTKQFDTREALAKAMDVFWEFGFEAASLSELMKRMGIGKKSLYDTFGNKRSLFLKVLDLYSQEQISDIRRILTAGPSALGNIETLVEGWAEMAGKPASKGCLLGTNIADFSTEDPEVAQILRGKLERIEDVLFEALTRAEEAGELREGVDPSLVARQLICLTQGVALVGRVMSSSEVVISAAKSTLSQIRAA